MALNGNGNVTLPRAVYHQCEWILKDYDRLAQLIARAQDAEASDDVVVFYTGDSAGLIPQSVVAEAEFKIRSIENALEQLPEEYREAIFEYYVHETRLPDEASENTWKRWKRAFIEAFARELNLY
ncbi:MAG: hypothetical protein KBS56_02440 [Clostridiales bacterium]|nr:hypothetical protein [Candidatus Crickella equi]